VTFSIDQNCHSLWDVLPKLQALTRKGIAVRHFIEDTDVAFTAMGARVDQSPSHPANRLRVALERFHRSGGADWGAALFYSEFLGRHALEIRDLEPMTGMKTNALARQLGRSVDELYDEFSPGDNWQLIGSSYVAGGNYHRTIGDLTVAETAEFLREIMDKAQADMLNRFPAADSQQRLRRWFAQERELAERLLSRHAGRKLVELYRGWLNEYLRPASPKMEVAFASELFACGKQLAGIGLLEVFTRDYHTAAGLYNEALAETDSKLRPLRTDAGELPFFATLASNGHLVRTGLHVSGREIRLSGPDGAAFKLTDGGRLPGAEMAAAGVRALAGKAIVLTIQMRLSPGGAALVLPYRGSAYMATSVRFAEKLIGAGMLAGKLHPVLRVRFRLLERLKSLETPIRLPAHLAVRFGAEEVPARKLGADYESIAAEAAAGLESFKVASARENWQRRSFPQVFREIDAIDARRRELAAEEPKGREIRQLSWQIKALEQKLLEETLRQAWRDYQLSRIDYWDSRGAILPWCVALGGEVFYNQLIDQAEVYEDR
jgi:hypothetical protein